MLEHLGEKVAARFLLEAAVQVLQDEIQTPDLGGTAGTSQVGDAVARAVEGAVVYLERGQLTITPSPTRWGLCFRT